MMRCRILIASLLAAGCPAADEPAASDGDTSDGGDDGGSTAADPMTTSGESDQESSGGDPDPSSSTGEGPRSGCGIDPGISGVVSGQIEAAGDNRRFILVVPDGYDPERAYPLVFMFHGRGSNGEEFRQYAAVEEAGAGEAFFVYPDALPQASQGNQTGWELTPNGSDMQLFDALLADFSANLCIDPERVFATGHSHGGFFSNALGCSRGAELRAIAPVAGGGSGAGCTGQVAAWLAHHPDDNVVPLFLGEVSRDFWVEQNHCSERTQATDPAPCTEYLGCDEGYEVVWCEHMDDSMFGPHSWPAFAGPAIWSFFARY